MRAHALCLCFEPALFFAVVLPPMMILLIFGAPFVIAFACRLCSLSLDELDIDIVSFFCPFLPCRYYYVAPMARFFAMMFTCLSSPWLFCSRRLLDIIIIAAWCRACLRHAADAAHMRGVTRCLIYAIILLILCRYVRDFGVAAFFAMRQRRAAIMAMFVCRYLVLRWYFSMPLILAYLICSLLITPFFVSPFDIFFSFRSSYFLLLFICLRWCFAATRYCFSFRSMLSLTWCYYVRYYRHYAAWRRYVLHTPYARPDTCYYFFHCHAYWYVFPSLLIFSPHIYMPLFFHTMPLILIFMPIRFHLRYYYFDYAICYARLFCYRFDFAMLLFFVIVCLRCSILRFRCYFLPLFMPDISAALLLMFATHICCHFFRHVIICLICWLFTPVSCLSVHYVHFSVYYVSCLLIITSRMLLLYLMLMTPLIRYADAVALLHVSLFCHAIACAMRLWYAHLYARRLRLRYALWYAYAPDAIYAPCRSLLKPFTYPLSFAAVWFFITLMPALPLLFHAAIAFFCHASFILCAMLFAAACARHAAIVYYVWCAMSLIVCADITHVRLFFRLPFRSLIIIIFARYTCLLLMLIISRYYFPRVSARSYLPPFHWCWFTYAARSLFVSIFVVDLRHARFALFFAAICSCWCLIAYKSFYACYYFVAHDYYYADALMLIALYADIFTTFYLISLLYSLFTLFIYATFFFHTLRTFFTFDAWLCHIAITPAIAAYFSLLSLSATIFIMP